MKSIEHKTSGSAGATLMWFAFGLLIAAHAGARAAESFIAPDGTIFPVVDGIMQAGEWDDASMYTVRTTEGERLTLYFKVVPLLGEAGDDCVPYATNPAFTLPCGDYLFIGVEADYLEDVAFYIDEGDDGGYGSGSGDGVLTSNQEDYHEVDNGYYLNSPYCYILFGLHDNCPEPACSPWTGGECWKCVPNISEDAGDVCVWSTNPTETTEPIRGDVHGSVDGYFGDGYWPMMFNGTEGNERSWGWIGFVGDNLQTAEFLLPFDGLDGSGYCPGCDVSDARFAWGDVLNIMFHTPTLLAFDEYPPNADSKDPSTWTQLRIGGEWEEEPGCGADRVHFPLVPSLVLGFGWLGLGFLRRRR